MYTPHNFFEAPKDQATPTPRPHQDEAAELAHADRSPMAAFVAIAAALAAFGLLWFGRLLLVPSFCLAAAAVVAALVAWRQARRHGRPIGVALAALAVALGTLVIVVLVWS